MVTRFRHICKTLQEVKHVMISMVPVTAQESYSHTLVCRCSQSIINLRPITIISSIKDSLVCTQLLEVLFPIFLQQYSSNFFQVKLLVFIPVYSRYRLMNEIFGDENHLTSTSYTASECINSVSLTGLHTQ